MKKVTLLIEKMRNFIEKPFVSESKVQRILHRYLKIFYITITKFFSDKSPVYASALTYSALLALVPVLAIVFSVMKGVAVKDYFRDIIIEKIAVGQTEVVDKIISFLENVNAARLGTIGALALIVTAILVLTNIERSFNHIWGISKTRKTLRKITDYLSVLIVGPIMFVGAMSVTALISLPAFMQNISLVSMLYAKVLNLSPYIMLWLAFTFFYIFIPNTKVSFKAALFGGFFASLLWQFAQVFYINMTAQMTDHKIIYGSLAALPIFLIWIYISWLILLLGAELSFAFQNVKKYRFSFEKHTLSDFDLVKLCVIIVYYVTRNFYKEDKKDEVINVSCLSEKLKISENIVNTAAGYLLDAKILNAENSETEELTPRRDPEKIYVKDIFNAVLDASDVNFSKEFGNFIDKPLLQKLNLINQKDYIMDLNLKQLVQPAEN